MEFKKYKREGYPFSNPVPSEVSAGATGRTTEICNNSPRSLCASLLETADFPPRATSLASGKLFPSLKK